ncbi:hypothetical protein [uncultured Jatrophihabitans sp.]|uniref:hypothetical protein n=1 Tax=uncultured Jatrophihabitans sp. TaxID=1610747 RepID=UPI0035CB4737
MSDYVLQVNYREDEEPVRITLHDYSPGDAETAHQALETEIEHARAMHAPVLLSGTATAGDPNSGVPIDPARVTGVDLVEPTA